MNKTIGFDQISKLREELQEDLRALNRVALIFSGTNSNDAKNGGVAVLERQVVEKAIAARPVGRPRGGTVSTEGKRIPIVQKIEHVVLGLQGQFGFADIVDPVSKQFPNESFNKSSIPNTLNKLVKEGKIKVIIPKSGRRGAIYQVS